MSFKAVRIPANSALPFGTLTLSKSGGLEKDALRLLAEAEYNASEGEMDHSLQQQQTIQELAKQGMSQDRIQEVMGQLMANAAASNGGRARLGNSVEIVCVGLAKPNNHYRGVTLYCDGNAPYKQNVPLNTRATKLAQACGLQERVVYGDCFLGRAHDDESQEWSRLDFLPSDCVYEGPDRALWIRDAALENAGKNMEKYTTTGALSSYAAQQQGGAAAGAAPASVFNAAGGASSTANAWSQTNEEVELRYPLPPTLKATDLEVTITRSSLRICRKGYAGSATPAADNANTSTEAAAETAAAEDPLQLPATLVPLPLQQPGGLPLFNTVIVGDSSWSKDGAELVVTLCKNGYSKWPSVFA